MPSIQSVHVHFPALLEQPPVGRVRKVSLAQLAPRYVTYSLSTTITIIHGKRGVVYPKLAQSKGSGDRMHSPDLFWGSRQVSAAISEPESKDAVPKRTIHLSPKPALPETAFVRVRKCFDLLTGVKLSSEHAPSPSSPQLFGFGLGGSLHARRCNAPVNEDGGPFVPSSPRPVFLFSTPVSSYSSGTSAASRGSGNSSVSVAFGVGV
ncbi:hypothetical protein EDB84DRAFT_1116270 [Lactarius hengduanensis]|nr:hypothetical protein EDB84DRAFT_1116270 [Lactarius hengduanensis]